MSDIDGDTCTKCNLPISYDETPVSEGGIGDDEACVRVKSYCTNKDEHVDWRASCLHASKCAQDAEARLATAHAECEEMRRGRDNYRNALSGILNHPFANYDAHGPSQSVNDRQWQIGFTDGVRDCSHKAGLALAVAGLVEFK